MAWAMNLPSSFGKYWPEGDIEGRGEDREVGWWQRLRLLYSAQPAEVQEAWFDYGDKRPFWAAGKYPFYVTEKFSSERGTRPGPLSEPNPPFGPVLDHEWPRFLNLSRRPYKKSQLASLIQIQSRLLAVDEALKDLIERFEPGVHEFWPLEFQWCGEAMPYTYYTLFINRYLDSLSPEDSDPGIFKDAVFVDRHSINRRVFDSKDGFAGLALKKSNFDGAHLWRERVVGQVEPIFLSDELEAAITQAGLAIPKHYRVREA